MNLEEDVIDKIDSSKRLKRFLAGTIVILLATVIFLLLDRAELSRKASNAMSLARVESKNAQIWRNERGLSQAKAEAAVANYKNIKEIYGDTLAALQKQIHGLKRNISNAHSLVTVSLKTEGQINTALQDTVVTLADTTTTERIFSYQDRWTSMNGIVSEKSVSVKYSFVDSIAIVSYRKRPGIFKNKKLYVEAVTYNPNTKFTGLKQIAIDERKSHFVLGPYTGIDFRGRPTIGVGIMYRLYAF